MIISIDLETKAKPGHENYEKAALDLNRNEITQIAWVDSTGYQQCFSGPGAVEGLNNLILKHKHLKPLYIGHNFKFDLKTLSNKGCLLTVEDYGGDTMLQAVADPDKIPDEWLASYEVQRKQKNHEAGKGVHREARHYSLKSLAPFHLNIEPFWEVEGHDDSDYALKDARYTLELYLKQQKLLKKKGALDFYEKKLMRWARMILNAEIKGIAINLQMLDFLQAFSKKISGELHEKLIDLWQEPFLEYERLQQQALVQKYDEMKIKAIARTKNQKVIEAADSKYGALLDKAMLKIEPFNLDSPSQIKWLLRDHFALDIEDFDGDESTGKPVLERLASEGRKDIKTFLDLRKHTKLSQAFFPSYKKMQFEGRLYGSFNLNGARTGRLSSSEPNLQQVPGNLHELFIAGEGRNLITKDLSNIEPLLIAYLTECPELCALMVSGRNFHNANTQTFFPHLESVSDEKISNKDGPYLMHRKMSKELGLSLLYGSGKRKIQQSAMKYGFAFSISECAGMHERFKKKYAAIFEFKKQLDRRLENGEAIKNLMGRLYKIPNKDDVYMKGFNTLIQGSASDVLLESAARANEEFAKRGLDAYVSLLVHDECVVNGPADKAKEVEAIMLEKMLNYTLNTPYGQIKLKAEGNISNVWQK